MPNIIGSNNECCIVIAGGYLCLSLFSSFHLAKITFYGHNPFSFQVLFGALTFLWTTIRVIFFGLTLKLSPAALILLYWIPSDLEWTVYLLILVFYLYWIQDEDALALTPSRNAKRLRVLINVVYVALSLMSFLKTLTLLFTKCKGSTCTWDTLNAGSNSFATFQYLCLCLVYTWILILIQIRRCKQRETIWDRLPKHGILKNTIVGRKYMFTFWIIFTSRMAYYWVLQENMWKIKISIDDEYSKTMGVTAFIFLCLWELVPTIMVLWCFRSIPATNDCVCWCWEGIYESDYESLLIHQKDYTRLSASLDSNWLQSPETLCHSPPHLHNTLQSNWSGDVGSVQSKSRRSSMEAGAVDDETDPLSQKRAGYINPLTKPESARRQLIRTLAERGLFEDGQSHNTELGPEFASDLALERSPRKRSKQKRTKRKKKKLPLSRFQ